MGMLQGSAFITGAASGIGAAAARAFAEHGITRLAITDINEEQLDKVAAEIRSKWPQVDVLAQRLDVTRPADVGSVLASVVSRFGRLDVAVNNAGYGGPAVQTHEMTDEEWNNVMDVNLHGYFWCQRAELRIMLEQEDLGPRRGRGCIVNVVSLYGIRGPWYPIHRTNYAASKHAVMGLTKADALSYGSSNIRINAICPGYVPTPLLGPPEHPDTPGHPLNDYKLHNPLQRLGKTEEIADSIVFLASSMASYVHGAGLVVDGGFSCG